MAKSNNKGDRNQSNVDRKQINNAKNLADLVQSQKNNIDALNTDIYGTPGYEDLSNVKKTITNIVNSYNKEVGGDLIASLGSKERSFSKEESERLEKIKNAIMNNKNINEFQSLLTSMDSKVSKYEDLMIITKIVPKLKEAKNVMLNSILSPDDFTKQIALNFMLDGKPLSDSTNPVVNGLLSDIKKYMKKYDVTKYIKHAIDRSLTLGTYSLAVLPYDKLYRELLIHKNTLNKSTSLNDVSIKESTVIDDKTIKEIFQENVSTVKDSIKQYYENTEVIDESCGLFDEEILLEEIKPKIKDKSFDMDKISKELRKNNGQINTSQDGMVDIEKIKNHDFGLTGCKIKKLDPRRLIKLEIDDTVFGYYYLETAETANVLRNPMAFKLKQSVNQSTASSGIDQLYRSLGNLLYKKLDFKFIDKCKDIKENLYDILKYADAANNNIKIIYLEPDDVVEFKIDESMFEQSLFYARIYMMLLLTNISAKIARSNDVRAYYVTTDESGGVPTMVMNAINTLKRNNRSFYSMTNLGKMISNFNVFDDLFLAKSQGDNKPLDFEVIQGQDINMDNEMMDILESIIVESTGVPLALLQTAAEAEFAKAYATFNLKVMRSGLDYQIEYNPAIEEFIKKILRSEKVNAEESVKEIIEQLSIYLQSPMNLLLTNALEQINNAKDLANGIGEILYGVNPPEDGRYQKFMLEVCKKYAPNIDWEAFEQIKKDVEMDNMKDKKSDEESSDEEY